jgi:signal transduction histidine kinase
MSTDGEQRRAPRLWAADTYDRFVHMKARWLVLLGLLGAALVGWLVWAWEHTEPPAWPVLIADIIAVVGLAVGPWLILTARRIGTDPAGREALRRVVLNAAVIAVVGVALGLAFMVIFRDEPHLATSVPGFAILIAGLLLLFGGVMLPWVLVLTRTVTQERAARIRAEERADVAAHLHDTVLQALTLIQKTTEDPGVLRLARGTERELRAWLYGAQPTDDGDFTGAVRAVAADVEDQYAVTVELITVGSRPLDGPTRAVIGALREALTNAARHAHVRRVSVFAEVGDAELSALIRDRGCGFDLSVPNGVDRRGIADSIEARMRQQGGTATIRSIVGEGTEVELRMPLAAS